MSNVILTNPNISNGAYLCSNRLCKNYYLTKSCKQNNVNVSYTYYGSKFIYRITSQEPMSLITWGLPDPSTNYILDNQDVSNNKSFECAVDVSKALSFNPALISPYVKIGEEIISCGPVLMEGSHRDFYFTVSENYDDSTRINKLVLQTSIVGAQISATIDGINYTPLNMTFQIDTISFDLDESAFSLDFHILLIKAKYMSQEITRHIYFTGKTPVIIDPKIFNYGWYSNDLGFSIDKQLDSYVEIYLDNVVVKKVNGSEMPNNDGTTATIYRMTFDPAKFEKGSHLVYIIVYNTKTARQTLSNYLYFTGTMPIMRNFKVEFVGPSIPTPSENINLYLMDVVPWQIQ